jgi:hypothetical protein
VRRATSAGAESSLHVKGAVEALAESTRLFKFYHARTPWPTVEKYLLDGPLRLADKTYMSGP